MLLIGLSHVGNWNTVSVPSLCRRWDQNFLGFCAPRAFSLNGAQSLCRRSRILDRHLLGWCASGPLIISSVIDVQSQRRGSSV